LLVAAGIEDQLATGAPQRKLTIRGREQPVDAFVLTA
jgi:hypothetical protein